MKNIVSLLIINLFVLFACEKSTDNYSVQIKIEGLQGTQKAFITTVDVASNKIVTTDTLILKNGESNLLGNIKQAKMHYLSIDGKTIPFILEKGHLTIFTHKDSIDTSYKLEGTINNNHFNNYIKKQRNWQKIILAMRNKIRENPKNNEFAEEYTKTYNKVTNEIKDYELNYVKNNFNSYLSLLLIEKLTNSNSIEPFKSQKLLNNLSKDIQEYNLTIKLKNQIEILLKIEVGKPAPIFEAPNFSGQLISLNDLKGKATLIDFWASWCNPCRVQNPKIVKLFKKYHSKGLELIGISLDDNATSWQTAVAKDNLTWTHLSNLKKWNDPIAVLYNVKSIPSTFLLDKKGIIRGINLPKEELEQAIGNLLQ